MQTATALKTTPSSIADDVKNAVDKAPSAIGEAAAQLQALTRRGLDRASELSATAREKASAASDRTLNYIQEEPVKAVLIAAAAGAAITLVASALTRRGN